MTSSYPVGIREFEAHMAQDHAHFGNIEKQLSGLKKHVRKWGMIGGILGGFAATGVHMLSGCGGALVPPGRPSDAQVALYGSELTDCIVSCTNKADAGADRKACIDACRTARRAEWCSAWPGEVNCLDAGKK